MNGAIEDDQCHRNYDLFSSRKGCQDTVACAETLRVKVQKAKRRHNRDFCVARSSFLEPCGKDKDAFYEQKLLLGLPWHCHRKPLTGQKHANNAARWFFETSAPNTPERLRRFSMTGRNLDASSTFEEMCVAFEQAYAQDPTGLLCECCQEAGCESCKHALGWHVCQRDRDTFPGNLGRLEEPPENGRPAPCAQASLTWSPTCGFWLGVGCRSTCSRTSWTSTLPKAISALTKR